MSSPYIANPGIQEYVAIEPTVVLSNITYPYGGSVSGRQFAAAWMYVYNMYVHLYVCRMYVRMYVCMYVCTYVRTYVRQQ